MQIRGGLWLKKQVDQLWIGPAAANQVVIIFEMKRCIADSVETQDAVYSRCPSWSRAYPNRLVILGNRWSQWVKRMLWKVPTVSMMWCFLYLAVVCNIQQIRLASSSEMPLELLRCWPLWLAPVIHVDTKKDWRWIASLEIISSKTDVHVSLSVLGLCFETVTFSGPTFTL